MTDTLFLKNVILKDWNYRRIKAKTNRLEGLEATHRKNENNEDYISLVGTKQQINTYLQDKAIISDRLRTLNNVPKYRIINSHKVRFY